MTKGCIVTIDAMGTQKENAKKIVKAKKADYALALKGNQGKIYDTVSEYFEDVLIERFAVVDHESLIGCVTRTDRCQSGLSRNVHDFTVSFLLLLDRYKICRVLFYFG
jgi:hypothetical protein